MKSALRLVFVMILVLFLLASTATAIKTVRSNSCENIFCPQMVGMGTPKVNPITGECYCGGTCGDNYCDSYEAMSGTCLKDCGFSLPNNPDCMGRTGDINKDGLINNYDRHAMRYILTNPEKQTACADVNIDGEVNMQDMRELRQLINQIRRLGIVLEPTLPGLCAEKGDINSDGDIDFLDLTVIREMIRDIVPSTECADMNEDGDVNGQDYNLLVEEIRNPGEDSNNAPVFMWIDSFVISEGQELVFTVSAEDADRDNITITADNLPEGAVFEENTFSWTPDYNQSGNYTIVFNATDGTDSTQYEVGIEVLDAEEPEEELAVSITAEPTQGAEPLEVNFTCSAENGASPYQYTLQLHNGTLITHPHLVDEAGDYTFTQSLGAGNWTAWCEVTDSDGENAVSGNITIIIQEDLPGNQAPVFEQVGPFTVNESEELIFNFTVVDPDGDEVTVTADNLPEGAVFGSDENLFTWVPTYEQSGNYTITFMATDGELNAAMNVSIEVVDPEDPVDPENMTATLTAEPTQGAEPLDVNFTCSVQNGAAPYNYLVFETQGNSTRVYSHASDEAVWNAENALDAGNYTVWCEVENNDDNFAVSENVSIEVTEAEDPADPEEPIVTLTADPVEGVEPLDAVFNCSVENGTEPYIFNLDSGDALGPSVTVVGMAGDNWQEYYVNGYMEGEYNAACTVIDGEGHEVSASVIINVTNETAEPENRAPVVNYINYPSGVITGTVNISWNITDPDGDNMTAIIYASNDNGTTWNDTGFGAWADDNQELFIYEIEADSTSVENGFYMARVNITDEHGATTVWTSEVFEVYNEPENHAPVFEQIDDIVMDEAETVRFQVNATDPDGDNVTYSADNIPEGAYFFTDESGGIFNGMFMWNPQYGDAGDYVVIFTASDGELNSTMYVAITVNEVAEENQMHVSLEADEMQGTEPFNVSFICSVENGTAPYTYSWEITLDENRTIAGAHMPEDNSSYHFNATLEAGDWTAVCYVSDSGNRTVTSNQVAISVAEPQNNPPVIELIYPENPLSGIIGLTWIVMDPEGDDFTWTIDASADDMASWEKIDTAQLSSSGSLMLNTTQVEDGEYWVRINAADEHGASASEIYLLNISNHPEDGDDDDDDDDNGDDGGDNNDDDNGHSHSSGGGYLYTGDDHDNGGEIEDEEEDDDGLTAGILYDDNLMTGDMSIGVEAEDVASFSFAKLAGILLWLVAMALALWMIYAYFAAAKDKDEEAQPQPAEDGNKAYAYLTDVYDAA